MKKKIAYEAFHAESDMRPLISPRLSFRQVRDVYFHLFQQQDDWNLEEINRKATALLAIVAARKDQAIDYSLTCHGD